MTAAMTNMDTAAAINLTISLNEITARRGDRAVGAESASAEQLFCWAVDARKKILLRAE